MSPATPRPRRWFGLPPRIALGFGAAFASLLVAWLFSAFALGARTRDGELVSHATANGLALEEVESALLVAHSSLDAWLGTRDARHRTRLDRASGKIAPALAELERLVDGERAERVTLEKLLPEVRAIRAEHEQALALADRGDFAAALALRGAHAGALALERAQAVIDELEQHEEGEVQARQLALARTIAVSNTGFVLAQGVVLVLVAFALRLVRDEIRAREENEAARAAALELQQRLMAMVSHDLRNPLTGILAAGWALTRAGLGEGEALLARRIVGAGRRMERLIRDLLDWSRVHGGAEIPISLREADLAVVCRGIFDELSDREPGRVRLECAGDTRGELDPDRVEQVVANLVGNALKYAPPGSPVHVRAVGDADELRLEVTDEGPGFPGATRAELFQAFQRRQPDVDRQGGLGLGLFIVRTLVEAHGGTVELESAPGRGSTFVVHLPRRPGARAAAARAAGGA